MDRLFATYSLILVIARVNTSSEEEEEMALNQRKGLRDLVPTSKEIPKTQIPPNLTPTPPPPTTDLGLLPIPNLKKKRKDQELKEKEVVPSEGAK